MYNPLKPNVYVEYKYERYCKRRRDEEAAIEKHRREREDTGNALSDALAGMSAPSNLIQHAGHVVSELPSLNLTAEEMHRLRVKESAARGVQRAVEMENDSLLVEQKTRRQEGTDTRGKISSLLDKMRKRANTQEPTAAAPSSDTTAPSSVPPSGKGTASVSGADGIQATPPSSSGPSSPVAPSSAPLGFKRSRMAAGGYVLDTIDGTAGGAPAAAGSPPSARMKVSLRGKPSSTLLIRFRTQPSPLTVVAASLGESARAAEYETALAPLLETIRQTCGRHGVVRSVRTCVLSASELATKAHDLSTTAQAEHESYLEKEKLRVFVRLDTVAEAFKAAEAIAAVQPSPAAVAMSPAAWSVVFFPSSLYDDGRLGPSDTEGLC